MDVAFHAKYQIMDSIKSTVSTETSPECQKASDGQDAARGQLKASFALDVKCQSVDSVNIFRVFLVICLISLCTLLNYVSAMTLLEERTNRIRKMLENTSEESKQRTFL